MQKNEHLSLKPEDDLKERGIWVVQKMRKKIISIKYFF